MENFFRQKKTAWFLAMAIFVLFGLLLMTPKSYARDDDRWVNVNGTVYEVRHDGDGPHIKISGMKYYLETDKHDKNRTVIVNGKRYSVQGKQDHC